MNSFLDSVLQNIMFIIIFKNNPSVVKEKVRFKCVHGTCTCISENLQSWQKNCEKFCHLNTLLTTISLIRACNQAFSYMLSFFLYFRLLYLKQTLV